MNKPSGNDSDHSWTNGSISRHIIVSFMLLLVISLAVMAYNIFGLNDIGQRFNDFRQASNKADLMSKINNDIAEIQRYILIFSHTNNTATIVEIKNLYAEVLNDISELAEEVPLDNNYEAELLGQMRRNADAFGEKIDSLQEERDFRDQLVQDKLIALFEGLDQSMVSLFAEAVVKQNDNVLVNLLQAQRMISNAEVYSWRYFSNYKSGLRKEITDNIEQASRILKTLQSLQQTKPIASQLSSIASMIKQTGATFSQSVQAERNYLFLVNVVVAGESSELRTVAAKLKEEFLGRQQEQFSLTEFQLGFIQQVAIVVALFAACLTILIAFLTGKAISKPLESITETFEHLIKGETIDEVPGANRRDEIGRLAQAANVFRETNEKTRVLLSQTEQFAEELQQREQALQEAVITAQEASLTKTQFLASMSHEIRTPMNGVIGMLHLLSKEQLNSKQQHYTELAKSSADSLLVLINDILDVSKIEAGKLDIEMIDFDLRSLFKDLSNAMAYRIQEKGLDFVLDIDAIGKQKVQGDPGRLRQILTNLVANALKFTEQGQITVRARLDVIDVDSGKQQLHCDIMDTGIGIASDKVDQLFDTFTQADSTTTRKYGGTGLGLSIVRQLCQLMGGSVEVSSELGKGSCFSFNLLLGGSDRVLGPVPDIDMAQYPVLIVDDDATNIEVLSGMLQKKSIEFSVCNSGLECLNLLERRTQEQGACPFKIAILDMQMPNMDGAELARLIRNNPDYDQMSLVMMTSMGARGDAQSYADIGFAAYLHKPAVAQDLYDAMALILSGQQASGAAGGTLLTRHNLADLREDTEHSSPKSGLRRKPKLRLLLVEDHPINQMVAQGMLEDLGYSVDVANNGLEAIKLLQGSSEQAYALILMDCQMPVMDGYTTTRNIRKGDAGDYYREISIVAMTANAMQGDREACLDAGMNDYLSKPIDEQPLTECLEKWLSQANNAG
ncbi:hybrid sensor histidine kinase/response regulator [Oceanicoccus sagamiensis]|uniref:Sensory/regulatory protein RpfC n=1 Tax=Oceanicoccus sagamiensis TaxID=716816 RepID=A0A1X9NAQ2_9GAMM|nr:response regulator [Oceanicoccus sagamiensis]ARN75118.1 hypothetical protein BST96_13935 [Oceanicoccus sagamiensis]